MKTKFSRREVLRLMALAATASLTACQSAGRTLTATNAAAEETQTAPIRSTSDASTAVPSGQSPTQAQPQPSLSPTQTQEQVEQTSPTSQSANPDTGQPYLSVAHGEDIAAITEAVIKALGGMERFVKNGYDVIIKPNMCTDTHTFEYGATTNPIVVATLVRLALGAGAGRVRVMDNPFPGVRPESVYAKSGIGPAVNEAGGEMEIMNSNKFRMTPIPGAKSLDQIGAYQDALNCDLLIDVPIAKHHSMATLTIGCKNLLGLIQNQSSIHSDFRQRIPDLVSLFKPGLTIVDATRTLMAHGPTGGNMNDVKINNMVIASHDIVAADSLATHLFNKTGADLSYLTNADQRDLGKVDLTGLKIEEINL